MRLAALVLVSIVVSAALAPSGARAQASFEILPFDNTLSTSLRQRMVDLSADGRTVGGHVFEGQFGQGGIFAARWDEGIGVTRIGTVGRSLSTRDAYAFGVSADGSTLVGASALDGQVGRQAVRFEADGSMTPLGSQIFGNSSQAVDVSGDGSIVAGNDFSSFPSPSPGLGGFIWDETNGPRSLGALSNYDGLVVAEALSDDGSIVVGFVEDASSSPFGAFRWTEAGGLQRLDDPFGGVFSRASAISGDGSTIVGAVGSGSGPGATTQGFRWTEEHGMEGLGLFNPFAPFGIPQDTWARGVSEDGSVIVGRADFEGVIWTEEWNEWRSIKDTLIRLGATGLEDWNLYEGLSVSADGRVITGWASNPNDALRDYAWRAVIPEPSTALSIALGLGLLSRWNRRARRRPGPSGTALR